MPPGIYDSCICCNLINDLGHLQIWEIIGLYDINYNFRVKVWWIKSIPAFFQPHLKDKTSLFQIYDITLFTWGITVNFFCWYLGYFFIKVQRGPRKDFCVVKDVRYFSIIRPSMLFKRCWRRCLGKRFVAK